MYKMWNEGGKDSMKENLLNRKTYKAVKKMDRQEMERFVTSIYSQGFKDGADAGQQVDTQIELVQFLEGLEIKGIGPKTKEKILNAYKERGKSDES